MHPISERLKERKIVQWALAYLAGAWLLLQVVDTFREPWGWSDWLVRGVHLALAAGFLLTIVLAWYHGEKGRQRVSGAELLIIAVLLFISGLLARLLLGVGVDTDPRPGLSEVAAAPDVPVRPSIAVLPFENLGDDADANLVDGIHVEIMTQMGKIRSLDPRSRTSVETYRDTQKDLRQIAEELGVRYTLEGTGQRVGDAIRLTVTLFEPDGAGRIWAESYNRDLETADDLLDLQLEIALQVATRVGAEIAPAERDLLTVEAPESLAAYESYLEGLSHSRVFLGVGGETSDLTFRRAEEAFKTAIDLEPNWAPPLSGLAWVYVWMASRGIDVDANHARIRLLADSALAIDSLYGPAWVSLGFVKLRGDRDFAGAEHAYDQAEALGADLGWSKGYYLTHLGRFEDAIQEYERAVRQNPIARVGQSQLGTVYFCAGRFPEAAEQLETAVEMIEGSANAHLAAAYLKAGRRQEALEQMRELRNQDVDPAMLAYLYASVDSIESARRFHEAVPPDHRNPSVVSAAAATHFLLEGPEAALDYLEEVERVAPRSLDVLDCFEEVRGLRGEPRYQELLTRLGHPGRGSASES